MRALKKCFCSCWGRYATLAHPESGAPSWSPAPHTGSAAFIHTCLMWAITFLGVCLLPTLTSLFKTCIACINLFLAVLRLRCRMAFPVNAGSGGCSPGAVPASLCPGFSRFGAQSPGRVAAVMWHAGLGVMWDVGSSRTRDRTVTAAMAGRFLSTGPPGKSSLSWTAQPCISLSL